MREEFTFRIAGSLSPDDFPLERLGEYLKALGEMFGESAYVHFGGLSPGSTIVAVRVDDVAIPKVAARVRSIAAGDAPPAALKAFDRVDNMLREDNATGQLIGTGDNVIHVDFPGRDRPEPVAYGPIKQVGVIDGEVHRVEGKDATVHVGLIDGLRSYSLEAPASMGHELAALFRSGVVRFHGEGTWYRRGPGDWELRKFKIASFDNLDSAPLSEAVARLRAVGPGGWANVPDALGELAAEREAGESRH